MNTKKMPHSIAGTKQVLRGVREGRIAKVILASDVDDYVRRKITEACITVPIESGPSMHELGQMCGITIGTAVIGIIKD